MIPLILTQWKLVIIGTLLAVIGGQYALLRHTKGQFNEYKLESEVASRLARERNDAEILRLKQNQKDIVDELQTRITELNSAYSRVRNDKTSATGLSKLSGATDKLGSCSKYERDTITRRLDQIEAEIIGVLQIGDTEINKFQELWQLHIRNAQDEARSPK